jgi:lysylphosphatidylglycerol synthetase-like protein (DUF2156 family)
MKALVGNAAKGIPSLLGVLWGIFLYRPGFSWIWQVVLAMVLASLFLFAGRKVLGKDPVVGWILIELWVLMAIGVVAASTAVILWLTVNAPKYFSFGGPEQEAISGALVGAVTTFLAVLWTKDIEDATGPLWPSTQFKNALSTAFASHSEAPKGDTRAWEAIYMDRVRQGPAGWGLIERCERARILREHLRKR